MLISSPIQLVEHFIIYWCQVVIFEQWLDAYEKHCFSLTSEDFRIHNIAKEMWGRVLLSQARNTPKTK